IAAVAIVSVRRSPTRREPPVATETHIVAEVAARFGKVLTRNAVSESSASTADMAKAADMTAANAADVSASAEAADMSASAEPAAHVTATAEASTVSTPTTARKRISGQSGAKRSSRRQDDHGLT